MQNSGAITFRTGTIPRPDGDAPIDPTTGLSMEWNASVGVWVCAGFQPVNPWASETSMGNNDDEEDKEEDGEEGDEEGEEDGEEDGEERKGLDDDEEEEDEEESKGGEERERLVDWGEEEDGEEEVMDVEEPIVALVPVPKPRGRPPLDKTTGKPKCWDEIKGEWTVVAQSISIPVEVISNDGGSIDSNSSKPRGRPPVKKNADIPKVEASKPKPRGRPPKDFMGNPKKWVNGEWVSDAERCSRHTN